MPQAAPFFTAFLYGAAAGASAGLVAAAALGTIVQVALINAVLGGISKALGPKGARGNSVPINVTVRNSIENRRVILGKVRAGGVIVYYNSAGTNKDDLYYVVAYAGHQVNAIEDVWLDSNKILEANINGGSASGGAVTQGNYTSYLSIWKYLGTSAQTADSTLTTAFSGTWTSNHRLRGIAYIVVKLKRNDKAYPNGPPQSITALVEGALLYDPREDSTNGGSGSQRYDDATTWTYPTNYSPALALRWVLTGGSVVNDVATPHVKYGLKESNDRILDAYTITAANKCDEVLTGAYTTPQGDQYRYTVGIELSTGQSPRVWIEQILACMAGVAIPLNGSWRMYAGAYDSPVYSLTDADVYGDIEIKDITRHEDRYNAVSALFRDSANSYIEQSTQFRTDSTYETQDGSEQLPIEIDLEGVATDSHAQRLAEIHKRKSRLMRTVKITVALNLLKIAPWETFTFTSTKYGWSNRVFRCLERQFDFAEEAGRVVITAQVENSAVYTDMATASYSSPNTHTQITNVELPDAPTSLTASSFPGYIKFTVGLPTYLGADEVVRLYEYTSSTPFSSATMVAEFRADTYNLPRWDTTSRYYWAVIYNKATQQVSTNYPSSTGVTGLSERATNVYTATFSATAITGTTGSQQTLASITVPAMPVAYTLVISATFGATVTADVLGGGAIYAYIRDSTRSIFATTEAVVYALASSSTAGNAVMVEATFSIAASTSVTYNLYAFEAASTAADVSDGVLKAEVIKI